MKDFITSDSFKKARQTAIAACLWLLIWQAASAAIGLEMLLASPVSVMRQLIANLQTPDFWSSVGFSLSRMAAGFLAAFVLGILLSVIAYKLPPIEIFLAPMMGVIKAAPVASYTILCLLLLPKQMLSVVISFLMALPIIYTNILTGLKATDRQLLEMADAFGIGAFRRVVYIYFSELLPFLISACSVALGFCWKSGIAAEVIGLLRGSIGEKLYQAKIFVDTPNVLAWTAVVIAISFLFEKVFLWLLKRAAGTLERM